MRRRIKKKNIRKPDTKYGSLNVEMFSNYVMQGGKKSVARKIVYSALDEMGKQTKKDALDIFETALRNTTPLLEVRSRRVGGANYQVPREVSSNRGMSLAIRWLIGAAKSKKGKPMYKKLAEELILASKNEGDAIKKRENMRKMAESNKAFAHFAW
ncbi:30S ribosomal protein S7 [Patescibacteria group bacterium]|nr:30S ribosomal protein S7 [Patescibacteria group bacterium]MBU2633058.1 30S ribosomal protein S7 [Patescibacteria group bacterium]